MEVSIRELKSHLSRYLAQAQAGEDIVVTSHKKIVAHIKGVLRVEDGAIQHLLDAGLVSWNGRKAKGGKARTKITGKTMAEMVLEDRG